MKLTKPQERLLADLLNGGTASITYPPTRKLIDLGLAEERTGKFNDYVAITEKGRTHMSSIQPPADEEAKP